MNKKGLLGGLTALSILAVAAVGFASVSNKGLFGGVSAPIVAKAEQNNLDWNGEIVTAEGPQGTAVFNGEGFLFDVTKNDGKVDWHVKLYNNSIALKQYESYQIKCEFTSNVASDEGKGVVVNANGGALWQRHAVIAGENVVTDIFASSNATASIEFQFGELGVCQVLVKKITITPVKNLLSGFEAAAWNDPGYNSSVVVNPDGKNYAKYSVNNDSAGGPWNVKLQALTELTLSKDVEYRVHYEVKISSAVNGVEILYGTRNDEYDYTEKWAASPNGEYEQTFAENETKRYTFNVQPNANITKIVFSIRAGKMTTGNVELISLCVAKTDDLLDTSSAIVSNLESGNNWKADWAAARALVGGLCSSENYGVIGNLIERYDNLTPSVRDGFKDTVDVDGFTYAQSIAYFRDRIA